jgi:hypothetical protein
MNIKGEQKIMASKPKINSKAKKNFDLLGLYSSDNQ